MDSAGKVRPVCAQQPATFSLPSFGHLFWETMRSFIICKNEGSETSLSCSESCTGWDHLSDIIESLGCSAGGSVQPWTNTYTYICEFKTLFVCSLKSRSTWRDVNAIPVSLGGLFLKNKHFVFFPSNHCDFRVYARCKVDITALPGIWIPGVGACEGLSCIKHPQLLLACCNAWHQPTKVSKRAESGHLIPRLLAGPCEIKLHL